METAHNSQCSMLNAQWILFAMLFLAAACNFSRGNGDRQPAEEQVAAIDTTFASRTDSVNPEWNRKLDSMLRVATTAKQDTNLAQLYIDIGKLYADNDFEKAKEYYLKVGKLSEELNWNEGRYLYASGCTNILYRQGMIDSGLIIIRQGYNLANKENNEKWIAKTLMSLGGGYFYKSWYGTALEYWTKALHIIEKTGDKETLIKLYDNCGVAYRIIGLPEKALEYDKKALTLFDDKESSLKGLVFYNLATASNLCNDEKTEYYFKEALRICKINNNQYLIAAIYLGLANMILPDNLYLAENYCHKSLKITTEINNPNLSGLANLLLGLIEIFKVNLKQAEKYCITSLEIAQKIGYAEYQVNAHRQLAILYAMQHNFENCAKSINKADSVERFMARESSLRSAEEMEVKYETEKKELKIATLEKERGLMIWLSIAGGAVLLLTMATFFFLWRWTIQKRRLAETRIKQLEQEKQLVATQAVLDGETRERARLARDLHDGLGSMLTGVKLSLLEMKKGATVEYPEVERFDKAMGLLDESVQEMRRVAHHLMPDSLSRFGLKPAVSDFCNNLPSVHFNYYGNESRLDPKMEVMIYRSIHELVNNALKHAGAGKIMVQIIQEPDRIAFTVQDDGCGFDPAAEAQGMGLQNIRTRIASYNGMIDINSKAGEGTEINVELKIDS